MGGMTARRTAEEIQSLVESYRQRTVTRTEYCQQQGITTALESQEGMVTRLQTTGTTLQTVPIQRVRKRRQQDHQSRHQLQHAIAFDFEISHDRIGR